MNEVFILSARRSPIGRFGGAFRSLSPAEIAAPVLRSALDQSTVPDLLPDLILMGHVLGGGHGQLVPRQAAKLAGIPHSVDAVGIDMVCSSGMMSLIAGAAFIQSGASNLILAGGVESMSDTKVCAFWQGQVGVQVSAWTGGSSGRSLVQGWVIRSNKR